MPDEITLDAVRDIFASSVRRLMRMEGALATMEEILLNPEALQLMSRRELGYLHKQMAGFSEDSKKTVLKLMDTVIKAKELQSMFAPSASAPGLIENAVTEEPSPAMINVRNLIRDEIDERSAHRETTVLEPKEQEEPAHELPTPPPEDATRVSVRTHSIP